MPFEAQQKSVQDNGSYEGAKIYCLQKLEPEQWRFCDTFKFRMACLYDDNNFRQQQIVEREMYNPYTKAVERSLIDIERKECHGCQIYDQQVDCIFATSTNTENNITMIYFRAALFSALNIQGIITKRL